MTMANIKPVPVLYSPDNAWPEPDLSVSKPHRPPAPILAGDDLNWIFGPWSDWLRNASEAKAAPIEYVIAGLLSVSGAMIGNARWASPWDGWKEPPVIWAMCVGDPSFNKSPGLDAVMDCAGVLEAEFAEAYKAERAEWAEAEELAKIAHAQWKIEVKQALAEGHDAPQKPDAARIPGEPIRERARIGDATIESVAHLMVKSSRGLFLSRDELAGWLGGMDRYSGGGGDRPFWLEAYGGRSYQVDRKGTPEPIVVQNLTVCVVGGTQTDKLDSLLVKADDDGLLARFMTFCPQRAGIEMPSVKVDEERMVGALRRLRELKGWTEQDGRARPFILPFSEDARLVLQDFREDCQTFEAEAHGPYKSHLGKFPGMAVRLASVLAHLDWVGSDGESPAEIGADHVRRASLFIGKYVRGHALAAYGFLTPAPR